MRTYFSTFTTGFADVVRENLKKNLSDVKIDLLLDGLIVYRTDIPYSVIEKLRFFNNTFLAVHYIKNLTDRPFSELRDWIKDSSDFGTTLSKELRRGALNLKLVFVEENQYIHLDNFFVKNLSDLINKKGHVVSSKQSGEQELWFLVRKEGYSLLGIRLTNHPSEERSLQKGELKPEIAHLLNLLSEPSKEDIFLDPFAGYGSIPLERSIAFPFKRMIVCDTNSDNIKFIEERVKGANIEIYKTDITNLKVRLGKTEVDKIVTDPPWSLYGEKVNIGSLYPQLLGIIHQVLKINGILVLLVSRSIDMEKILNQFQYKLKMIKKIDTLINGQKATAYKIQRLA